MTGGIAAYKSAELIRRLQDRGADVRVVMTGAATEFITPLTLQALSGHPVPVDLLSAETESVMGHIELARWADLVLVAPASANFLARMNAGQGDDLLTTICLAAECPIAIAPAMNQAMWANASTQGNVAALRERGLSFMGPDEGLQACGETGAGRLMDVDEIVRRTADLFANGLLAGRHVVITAGPTREAIDPVRYISNHSSGKQGYSLAEAALEAGASVTLISGPTNLVPPERARVVPVTSALEMYDAAMHHAAEADVFIGVAAVADYRPATMSEQKIKKGEASSNRSMTLELIENPDIIASVASANNNLFTVGFAAETENLLAYARRKLEEKGLNMIVANNVADTSIGFNSDDNRTTVLWPGGESELPMMSKRNVSAKVISLLAERISAQQEAVA